MPPTENRAGVKKDMEFLEFEIDARRLDPGRLRVNVEDSPAGSLGEPCIVQFKTIDEQSLAVAADTSLNEAVTVGRLLGQALLPPPVFEMLKQSLKIAARDVTVGLRLRLVLDDVLSDLPWEYVYRPDMPHGQALSGFLLLDSSISMVRELVDPRLLLTPVRGRQRLVFVGTYWPDGRDLWGVENEYRLLGAATRSVRELMGMEFVRASIDQGIENALHRETAVFHYSGHTDEVAGQGYLVREAQDAMHLYSADLAILLKRAGTRLAVFSACNSARRAFVSPLLQAGLPATLGIHSAVFSDSATEFSGRLYQALALGMSLDEAVISARIQLVQWGLQRDRFDWGQFVIHMPVSNAILMPRMATAAIREQKLEIRKTREANETILYEKIEKLDGAEYGTILSKLADQGVLILGRFRSPSIEVLKAIKSRLTEHPGNYLPILFTFDKPDKRDLAESILTFAGLARFVIADLTDPKSIPAELEKIVPQYPSLPVVPIIREGEEEYALFQSIQRRKSVVNPTFRYRDLEHLLESFEQIIYDAESKLAELTDPSGDK
jgi:hypothetical protein